LSGKTKSLKADTLLSAANFLGVNPKWLASGVGPRTLEAPDNVHRVEEQSAIYDVTWPFRRVKISAVRALSAADLAYLEGRIAALLEELHSP